MPKTLDQHIDGLQNFLNGNDDTDDEKTQKATRLAIIKQASQDMSPEEKKEARKAFDEEDKDTDKKDSMDEPDKDKKDSMDEPDKDKKDSKKSKKGKSGMDEEEKDEKIASLTATVTTLVAQPTIEKMLKARTDSGMPQEEVVKFGKSLYGKSIDEINQRYKEDQHLFKPLVGSTPQGSELPFNGTDDLMLNAGDTTGDKTMEEMLSA